MSWFVGVDRADRKHTVAVVEEGGGEDAVWEVCHSREGLSMLVGRLRELSPDPADVLVGLEDPHGLVVEVLLEAGHTVYAVNPKAVDRYRERWRPGGSKSDALDALVLAHLLRTDGSRHRPIRPSSDLARELQSLTRHRRSLVALRTRLLNQLRAVLKAYYPQALGVFSRLGQPITLSYLEAFPGPDEAAALTPRRWRAFLRRHRYPYGERADAMLVKLREGYIPAPDWAISGHKIYAVGLTRQLQALLATIAELEAQIDARFAAHPDAAIFGSMPGAGSVLASELLAEVGDARQRYPTPESLRAEAGTAPVTRASGQRRSVHFRRACNSRLRHSFQQLARQSVRRSAWAKAYYTAARARGHSRSRAARGLADKWARILWRMWIDRTTYDESLHQRRLAARAQPLAA